MMSNAGPENKELFNPDGAPDWDAITFDVLCSRCGYNLRTLTRPKCTECGLEFDWRQVVTWTAHQSEFLFEHQWRSQPLRSFLTTVWRSLRPRTFWASVSIHQQIRQGALWFLILIAPLVFWGLVMGVAYGVTDTVALFDRSFPSGAAWRAWWTAKTPLERHLLRLLWDFARPFHDIGYNYSAPRPWAVWLIIVPSVWVPLAAMVAVLCGLRQTLAKCRVRPVQMLRVTAYAAIPACISCAFALLANMWAFDQIPYDHPLRLSLIAQAAGPLIALLIFAYYLRAGLKHYLKLPRAGLIATAVALIGMLALLSYFDAIMWIDVGFLRWFPPIMPFS